MESGGRFDIMRYNDPVKCHWFLMNQLSDRDMFWAELERFLSLRRKGVSWTLGTPKEELTEGPPSLSLSLHMLRKFLLHPGEHAAKPPL